MALIKCQTISGEFVEIEESQLLPRPCAYGLIIKDNSKLLVEVPKEAGGKYWFIGGGLEQNEDPQFALRREAREEAHVQIEIISLLTSLEYCYYHDKLQKYYRCNSDFYICKYISSISVPGQPQVSTKWLAIKDINAQEFHVLIRDVLNLLKASL